MNVLKDCQSAMKMDIIYVCSCAAPGEKKWANLKIMINFCSCVIPLLYKYDWGNCNFTAKTLGEKMQIICVNQLDTYAKLMRLRFSG